MKIPGFKCRCAPRLNMFHRCRDLAPKIQAPSPLPANSVCTAFLRTPGFNQLCLSRATSISTSLVEAGLKGPSRPRCAWTHKPRPAGPRRGNACRGCQVDPPRVATLSTRQAGCACRGNLARHREQRLARGAGPSSFLEIIAEGRITIAHRGPRDVAGWSMVASRRGGQSNARPMPAGRI